MPSEGSCRSRALVYSYCVGSSRENPTTERSRFLSNALCSTGHATDTLSVASKNFSFQEIVGKRIRRMDFFFSFFLFFSQTPSYLVHLLIDEPIDLRVSAAENLKRPFFYSPFQILWNEVPFVPESWESFSSDEIKKGNSKNWFCQNQKVTKLKQQFKKKIFLMFKILF